MFRVMFCVIVAAASAQAWEALSPVPAPAVVGTGSAITYGHGRIWGIFPNEDSGSTYFAYYDTSAAEWVYPGEELDLDYLENTAITYQWLWGGAVFVVGFNTMEGSATLNWIDVVDSLWDSDYMDLNLGAGTSVAFRPAPANYGPCFAGWLHLLTGGGRSFYAYAVPGPGDVALSGICPGESALLADQTPRFVWQSSGASQYRLMVSTDPNFGESMGRQPSRWSRG